MLYFYHFTQRSIKRIISINENKFSVVFRKSLKDIEYKISIFYGYVALKD